MGGRESVDIQMEAVSGSGREWGWEGERVGLGGEESGDIQVEVVVGGGREWG